MDYIIVQDISQYTASGNYGIAVYSSAGSLVFDSRKVQTNETLQISQVVSADTSSGTSYLATGLDVATLAGINTSTDYINIEWAEYPGGTTVRGIGDLGTTTPDMLDAEIDEYQSGDEYFVNFGQRFPFLAANLG